MNTIYDLKDLDTFIELLTDLAFFKNTNGQYTHCNDAFLNFLHLQRKDAINKTDLDLFSEENAVKLRKDDKKILTGNETKSYEEALKKENEDDIYFYTTKQILYDDGGNKLGLFCIARNITLQKEYEIIYKDNSILLEYIAMQDNLKKILDKIVNLAEKRDKNSMCSILLLDKDKKHLLNCSAPSLPGFYNKAVNGIEIGEKVGSCGNAAFKKKRVIVENIDTHENWVSFLSVTKKANLHACWSEPILSSKDEILGTFAIYHTVPKKPSDFELKLISSYAHLASVAIEKDYNEKALKEKKHQILEQTKIANEKLRSQKYELSLLFNNALVGLMYITRDRILIKGNRHLANILGYENPEEMVGISMQKLHLSEERYMEFGKTYFEALKHKELFHVEYQLRKKDSTPIWCELSGTVLNKTMSTELSKGFLWTIRDIDKRKALEEKIKKRAKEIRNKNLQLKELASKDYLTGLYNRSKLDEALEYRIKDAKRYNTVFGIIMIDIDFFKEVNDNYGHQTGDKVLCEFSDLLIRNSRETDIVGRWGGEEFLIIVKNINKDNIIKLAEKLRENIKSYEFYMVKHKTASFGTAIYSSADEFDTLISRVDEALYQAKKRDRNCVEFL